MKIGVNLAGNVYYSAEQPFLNILRYGRQWYCRNAANNANTGEETSLALDADGHPTSVSFGTTRSVQLCVFNDIQRSPYYPNGRYVVVYTGTGTLTYSGDAVRNAGLSTPGRDVFDVATATNTGIFINITSTSASPNHLKIQYIVEEQYEALAAAGQIWHPTYLTRVAPFRCMRFLDMEAGALSADPITWSNRNTLSTVFWSSVSSVTYSGGRKIYRGLPIEAQINLCNTIRADLWLCLPAASDDTYETNAANLVKSTLDRRLIVWRESWNEEWNFQTAGLNRLGAAYINAPGDTYTEGFYYNVLRTVLGGKIWRNIFGARGTADGERLRVTIGSQAANSYVLKSQLWWKCDGSNPEFPTTATSNFFTGYVGQYVDAVNVAPYYYQDGGIPEAWTNETDGGLTKMFTEASIGGLVPTESMANSGGTSTAYTLTTGLSLSARPADQTIVCFTAHTNSGANPTLKADGGTAYPLKTRRGGPASSLIATGVYAFIFDRTTDEWTRCPFIGNSGGEIARSAANLVSCKARLTAFAAYNPNIELVCYEGGPHLVDFGNDQPHLQTTFVAFNSDPRIYDLTKQYRSAIKATGVTLFNYYQLISRYDQNGYWGAARHREEAPDPITTPKLAAITDDAIAERTRSMSWN